MADFKQLDVLINDAGVLPTAINDAVVTLIDSGKVSVFDLGPLLTPLGNLSKTLAAIQKWNDNAKAGVSPKLPAGMEVVDVGSDEGAYTGRVNEATLTDANRTYIANNEGKFSDKWGQVFNAKVHFPAAGGDAMSGPQDPITPDGYDLSTLTWVRVGPN